MKSFYADRPARSFWKTGVSDQGLDQAPEFYRKKFDITRKTRIMTAGSCFAQHIAANLAKRNFRVIDKELPPKFMTPEIAKGFGYKLYSARYGNVYTTRQLRQLFEEASGRFVPSEAVWTRDGRYFDALRPNVEPQGLDSAEEVMAQRRDHLGHVREAIREADLLIFTFGLTEAWVHRESGTVYPTAPGTIAGEYDPARFEFQNFSFNEVYADFVRMRRRLKKMRPDLKFLVTVSPVPLTATASDDHVLTATIYSKSVLRAVAGQLSKEFDDIDYFPSYEIVATPFSRQLFYEQNLRSVAPAGVETVMRVFFREHGGEESAAAQIAPRKAIKRLKIEERKAVKNKAGGKKRAVRHSTEDTPAADNAVEKTPDDVVCEEMLLEAFAR